MSQLLRTAALILASFSLEAVVYAQNAATAPQSTDPEAAFASTRTLLQRGQYDDAISQLKALEGSQPSPKGLTHELGTAYYKQGAYAQATAYLKKALDEDSADKEATQLLGLSYYLSGHPTDAIPLLEKVQGWFPRANIDAAYILGVCYIQSKDYDHARSAFSRMFDVPQNSAASYLFTARMLMRQEFDPVAEEYALKATALDPKLPQWLRQCAICKDKAHLEGSVLAEV